MNYQELSAELNRPLSTIRKWRAEIERISGIDFERIKIRNGKRRKNRTTYDFTQKDVENFKDFIKLLKEGKSKEQAIILTFGSVELRKKKSEEEKIALLNNRLLKLENDQHDIQRQITLLLNEVRSISSQVESLENKGFKNIFRK